MTDDSTDRNGTVARAASNVAPLRKTVPCPECRRPSHREHYPFCSDRCRNVDLNRWLTGAYAIPVSEAEESPDDETARHQD
ncbi:DNA gyrase inhibitor YacG [Rhizobium sp. YIM 134829]|uniref:DNA gyrase inhibitor YacG n=1 Tax=Rhizobium sp. YIM 134829 TaxID=3390453 RepID=UPI00397C01C1